MDHAAPSDGTPQPIAGALRRLAGALGVIDHYHDAFGTWMEVPDDALVDALAALGVPAADDAAAAVQLAALDEATWATPLPPCVVIRTDDPEPRVPLVWPDQDGEGDWRLDLEPGTDVTPEPNATAPAPAPTLAPTSAATPLAGTIRPSTLPVLATHPGDGRRRLSLPLPTGLPPGYHHLTVRLPGGTGGPVDRPDPSWTAALTLIVAPPRCWLPEGWEDEDGPRLWGVACQVHGLRSRTDWGMGDFTALAGLARIVGREGGDLLGVNPLHPLFVTRPLHASPYSPNSRLFLNPLYIAIPDVPEYADCAEIREMEGDLESLREPDLIDLAAVAQHKTAALAALYRVFADQHLDRRTARGEAFAAFVTAGGVLLRRYALFQALAEHHAADPDGGWSWPDWPEEERSPKAAEAAGLVERHRDRMTFHLWCQFEADRQLARVARVAAAAGQRLGLYRDLALGSDPTGADCWALADQVLPGHSVGAPPDPWNAKGQNWGFPAFHPDRLKAAAYAPFVRMIRANMRHAGALRMDHVLGLMRLFCIGHGREGREGFYLRMPMEDLLGVLALESHRNRCLVIGEDLGTVPDGFRDRMQAAAVLSCRMFYFERHPDHSLRQPSEYPRLAAVAAASHDLPTLVGFWAGRDLAWKNTLDLFPSASAKEAESMERHHDRPRIREAFARFGLPLEGSDGFTPPANLVPAVTAWTAATPSLLLLVQIEDVLEEVEQANMPGTVDSHPNWRRRSPVPIEDLEQEGRLDRLARLIAARGRGRDPDAGLVRDDGDRAAGRHGEEGP